MKALRDDNRQFKSIVDEKIKEIEPLNQALGKLRNANNAGRNGGLCSSEEELNAVVSDLSSLENFKTTNFFPSDPASCSFSLLIFLFLIPFGLLPTDSEPAIPYTT